MESPNSKIHSPANQLAKDINNLSVLNVSQKSPKKPTRAPHKKTPEYLSTPPKNTNTATRTSKDNESPEPTKITSSGIEDNETIVSPNYDDHHKKELSENKSTTPEIKTHTSNKVPPTIEDSMITLRALLSSKEAGIIIGRGGKSVSDLRNYTNVKAGVSKVIPGIYDRVLSITGHLGEVAKAYEFISDALASNHINPITGVVTTLHGDTKNKLIVVKILISHSLMGSIIGKQGLKIKKIQDLSDTKIVATKEMLPQSTERIVEIHGSVEGIKIAIYEIGKCLIEDWERGVGTVLYNPTTRVPSVSSQSNPYINNIYSSFEFAHFDDLSKAGNFSQTAEFNYNSLADAIDAKNNQFSQSSAFSSPFSNSVLGNGLSSSNREGINSYYGANTTSTQPPGFSRQRSHTISASLFNQPRLSYGSEYMYQQQLRGSNNDFIGSAHTLPPKPHNAGTTAFPQVSDSAFNSAQNMDSGGSGIANFRKNETTNNMSDYPSPLNRFAPATGRLRSYSLANTVNPFLANQQINNDPSSYFGHSTIETQEVTIPGDMVGCIIGKSGTRITEIRKLSKSRIAIAKDPSPESGDRLFTITGTPENNKKALFLIYGQLEAENERRIANAQLAVDLEAINKQQNHNRT
ncbi:hypothetical protein BB558_005898 [Smittium angustum]|uniref:K Homology domain-containing protein n=1 Tax=Smittium angustum TaxID=133377 RepID=A0A2U1IZA2_SMIAN|nr:hypothetical protein BB558_005898 [Smittium angustum]